MLWLAAYLTGFPPVGLHALRLMHGLAPMWSGLYIISTDEFEEQMEKIKCVSMPSQAYTSFLHAIGLDSNSGILTVSMPSRAYTSFLQLSCEEDTGISVPVSMPSRAYTSFLPVDAAMYIFLEMMCQCPLGLIPHFYRAIPPYIKKV